ncbi:polcalcin Bra n 2 [Biomphalaria pfeifferi]|uniref:Polcalcin Bra n 2 n=1 Tax=Biomphalaria pfeifferi TaxID=112525 RepID=A0AAD8AS51_BIOPF|nr:polcalcin Bra n 2 [Biomphalaria pfeifferi]
MLTFTALLICLPALALCQAPDIDKVAGEVFAKADSNSDGNVVKTEMENYFLSFDRNNDSRISRHEYTERITEQYGHDPQLNHILHNLYDQLDINSDNHVDKVDIDGLFAVADADKNNQVAKAEFTTFFSKAVQTATAG